MRCPDCNKFVPNGELEVEQEDISLDGKEISLQVHAVIPCGECGTELKTYDFDVTEYFDISHECDCPSLSDEEDEYYLEPEYEIMDDGSPEPLEEFETKDRHGKPVKNPHYQKHLYGFTQSVTIRCIHCNAVTVVDLSEMVPSSNFNEY